MNVTSTITISNYDTTTEQELPHIFRLTQSTTKVYRCIYCEVKADVTI